MVIGINLRCIWRTNLPIPEAGAQMVDLLLQLESLKDVSRWCKRGWSRKEAERKVVNLKDCRVVKKPAWRIADIADDWRNFRLGLWCPEKEGLSFDIDLSEPPQIPHLFLLKRDYENFTLSDWQGLQRDAQRLAAELGGISILFSNQLWDDSESRGFKKGCYAAFWPEEDKARRTDDCGLALSGGVVCETLEELMSPDWEKIEKLAKEVVAQEKKVEEAEWC